MTSEIKRLPPLLLPNADEVKDEKAKLVIKELVSILDEWRRKINLVYNWEDTVTEMIDQIDDVGVSDHGALTGLADDDHMQYVRANGTRVYTGTGDGFKDEDDMVSDSAAATASQQSIKKYVDDNIPTVYIENAVTVDWALHTMQRPVDAVIGVVIDHTLGAKPDIIQGWVRKGYEITAVNQGGKKFRIEFPEELEPQQYFQAGVEAGHDPLMVSVAGSTGNDGDYTIVDFTNEGLDTWDIEVAEAIPDDTVDGHISDCYQLDIDSVGTQISIAGISATELLIATTSAATQVTRTMPYLDQDTNHNSEYLEGVSWIIDDTDTFMLKFHLIKLK